MGKSGLYGTADAAPRPVDFLRKPAPGRFASRGETPKRLSPHPFCGVREKNVLHGRFFTFERPAFSGSRMRYGNRFTRGLNARDFPKSCLRRRLRRLTPALPGLRVLFGSLALPPSLKLWRDKPGLPCGFAVLTPARIVVFYSPPACHGVGAQGEDGRARRRPPRTDRVCSADVSGCFYRSRALMGTVIQPQITMCGMPNPANIRPVRLVGHVRRVAVVMPKSSACASAALPAQAVIKPLPEACGEQEPITFQYALT